MTNFSRIFVTTCRDLTDFEGMVGLRLVLEEAAAKSTMEKSLSETRSSLDSKSSRFFTGIAIFWTVKVKTVLRQYLLITSSAVAIKIEQDKVF